MAGSECGSSATPAAGFCCLEGPSSLGNLTVSGFPSTRESLGTEWVALQFDDRVFPMLRSTLTSAPNSLFARLFATDSVSNASLAHNYSHPLHPVIFDRSARFVEPVLNYLRSGELVIPGAASDPAIVRGVYLEAQYFGVDGILEELKDNRAATCSAAQRLLADGGPSQRSVTTRSQVENVLLARSLNDKLRWAGMRFDGVDFSGLNLSGIAMPRVSMNHCLLRMTDLTGCVLDDGEFIYADFTSATLVDASCRNADFRNAKFCSADCRRADFGSSLLVEADFSQCNLQGSKLNMANMTSCILMGTNLKEANLRNALLHGVERQGTSLTMGGVIA